MSERLSDEELREAVEDFRAMIAGKPDAGYALTNGDTLRLLEELVAARARDAVTIGTGQVVTLAFEDGRRALASWCDLEDCECPAHEDAAPPAGTYVTVRMDGDPAVGLWRVKITREAVTGDEA